MAEDRTPFEAFGVLEVMGHLRLAGHVSEQVMAGTAMLRIDVPPVRNEQGAIEIDGFTRFFGGSSVYSFTPTSEDVALRLAHTLKHRPIQAYDLMTPAERRQQQLAYSQSTAESDDGDGPY